MNFNTTLKKIMINLIKEHKDTNKKSNQGRKYKESIENYVDAFFNVLKTGCDWKYITKFKGFNLHYTSYNKKFNECVKNGIFNNLLTISLKLASFYNKTKNYFIDSSVIRNMKSVKSSGYLGHSYKIKTKLSTKITILINDNGLPVSICYSKSSIHDINFILPSTAKFEKINKHKLNNSSIIGDKAYTSKSIKDHLKTTYNINYIYPSKINSKNKNDSNILKNRFINEQIFSWINNYKRICVINEKNYVSFMNLYNLAICDHIFNKIEKIN